MSAEEPAAGEGSADGAPDKEAEREGAGGEPAGADPVSVAVVIPTYNRAAMVVQAAESALGQTHPCRVVVVDDGSTDDTLERLERFGDALAVVRQPNRERGAARNAGARAAREAELLIFLDADDVLDPDHVETMADLAASHPEASLVSGRMRLTDGELSPFSVLGNSAPGPIGLESFLLGGESVPPSATAIRRDAFEAAGRFDERRALAGSEDWLLVARLLTLAPGVRGERVTASLRRHEGSSMADAASMHRSMLLAAELYFEGAPPSPPPRLATSAFRRRCRARLLLSAATAYYGEGEMPRARRTLLKAASEDPGVALRPLWSWTLARSLLGRRLSGALRRWRRGRGS